MTHCSLLKVLLLWWCQPLHPASDLFSYWWIEHCFSYVWCFLFTCSSPAQSFYNPFIIYNSSYPASNSYHLILFILTNYYLKCYPRFSIYSLWAISHKLDDHLWCFSSELLEVLQMVRGSSFYAHSLSFNLLMSQLFFFFESLTLVT